MQLLFDQVLPRYEEGAITGNQDNVKHYIGEMYVNRAYSYFQLFTKFGDLPIVTTALPDIQGELVEASKRQPRHKVARFIIEDLKKAEDMLLNNPPGGKNRISKNVAYLLHARVALYEATWENIIVVQLLYREEADGRVKMRKVMMLMWKLIISLMKRLLLRSLLQTNGRQFSREYRYSGRNECFIGFYQSILYHVL